MKITYRIPSKKVPYGYIEIEHDQGFAVMPDPSVLAEEYANYIQAYQAAEIAAFESAPKVKAKAHTNEDINDVAAQEIKSQLGATEVDGDDPDAPWNKNGEETTASETASSNEDDWDFDD